jgi:hypothetical protein
LKLAHEFPRLGCDRYTIPRKLKRPELFRPGPGKSRLPCRGYGSGALAPAVCGSVPKWNVCFIEVDSSIRDGKGKGKGKFYGWAVHSSCGPISFKIRSAIERRRACSRATVP